MSEPGAYAVVTGSSQGLGRAFARACARRGWNLALSALPGTGLPELAEALRAEYCVDVRILETDLAAPGSIEALVRLATAGGAEVALLVNNVGASRHGYFDLIPLDIQRRIVDVNVQTTMALTHALIPALAKAASRSATMDAAESAAQSTARNTPQGPASQVSVRLRRRPSRILTVASMAGLSPMPLVAVYAASKAFLVSFGIALRQELRPLGISSSVLCPGPLLTSEEVRRRIDAQGLGGRLARMSPDRAAEIALRGALRGRARIVPGRINKLIAALASLIPTGIYTVSVYRRWQKAFGRMNDSPDVAYFARPASAPGGIRPEGCDDGARSREV
jgi:short-subunit dehydrogenase